MIQELETPIVVRRFGVEIQATHFALGFTLHPIEEYVRTSILIGCLTDGKFDPIQTDEGEVISGAHYATLVAANDEGKKANSFRTDDVLDAHAKVREERSRRAAEEAEAVRVANAKLQAAELSIRPRGMR